jgi:hypothetical protein
VTMKQATAAKRLASIAVVASTPSATSVGSCSVTDRGLLASSSSLSHSLLYVIRASLTRSFGSLTVQRSSATSSAQFDSCGLNTSLTIS